MTIAQLPSRTLVRRARGETTSNSRTIGVLYLERSPEDDQQDDDQCRDQEGGRGAARVLRAGEEVDDQVPDHHAARAAHELRGEVLAEDRDEDEDHGGRDARPDLWQEDADDRRPWGRSEVHRRLELVPVEALERRIQR